MADLTIRKTTRLLMSGGSSVKTDSKPLSVAILMFFGGKAEVILVIKSVNTIVIESDLIINKTDYVSITTNPCIGTSIQSHGPPMVDDSTNPLSFTVFTVYLIFSRLLFKHFFKLYFGCDYSGYRR